MKRALTLLLLSGCPDKPAVTPEPAPAGLRVKLPDGWRASPLGADLVAGPQGRAVVKLEKSTRPLPSPDALAAAVEANGGSGLQKESSDSFSGVVYLIEAGDAGAKAAFLGARQTGPRTVWCSTTAAAEADEVAAAVNVCRNLSWEGT